MTVSRPPLSETAKAVQAAKPAEGFGPSVRQVLRGLREKRPPVAVLLAALLMAVPVVALVAVGVRLEVHLISLGVGQALVGLALLIILWGLAGLQWRGVKRTLHLGEYDGGLFLASLSLFGLVVCGAAIGMMALRGRNIPADALWIPGVVVALWLPGPFLLTRAAKGWPQRVILRRGTKVADAGQAALLPALRAHTCKLVGGNLVPAQPYAVVPVSDEVRSGWQVHYTCWRCGQPGVQLAGALRPEDKPDLGMSTLGGADLWWVGELGELAVAVAVGDGQVVDPAALDGPGLDRAVLALRWAVWATRELHSWIPPGGGRVPRRLISGRVVPAFDVATAFDRAPLEESSARRVRLLELFEAEQRRRTTV